ncbi:MAG: efflux RND transporter periplasmic adaptor subunit [Bacteroidetes bacterium]|nr:efflux RND transporter periplasmic adaptor subunit [Bacteroidota bacterium]
MANEDISKLKIQKQEIEGYSKSRKKITYAIIALILAIILIALFFNGFFTPSVEVQAVTVSKMYPSHAFTLLNASGYVAAQRKASVASKVTGRLVALSVEEGSRVKKDEIIGRLENEDVIALERQASENLNVAKFNMQQVQAELNDATSAYKRNQELLSHGYISQADYDAGEARYQKALAARASSDAAIRAAKAALDVARLNIEYTMIKAPFDGVVLTKNADIGDIVTPIGAAANAKSALVTMADMDSLQAEVDVSESNLWQIKIGQPCEIQLDALPESRFIGIVHMIVPTADRSKASVLVKVKFIDKDIRILPEMSTKVAFLSREMGAEDKNPLTVISSSAIIQRDGKKIVFAIIGDRVRETAITTGSSIGESIEVTGGLNIGDRVVVSPLEKLKDGVRVRIPEK